MQHRMDDLPRRARQVGVRGRPDARAERCSPRSRDRGAGRPPATSTTSAAAHQGPLGLELVGDPQGARLPLPGRRPRDRRPQQPVRGPLRPARAGAPRRRCSARPTPTREEAEPRAGPPRRPVARRRDRAVPAPTTTGCASPTTASRRVATLVEAGELVPVRVEGWTRPAYLHRDARLPAPGRAPARCSARSTRWCGSATRTEPLFDFHYRIEIYVPGRSGCTATTCCRSCSATGSSPGSTSRPTAAAGRLLVSRRRTPSRRAPARPPTSWPPSCGGWPAGSASTTSWSSRAATSPRRSLALTRRVRARLGAG